VDQPGSPNIAAAFAHYEPYGIVPEGWMDQLRLVRESCPVVRSDACGGFWLVGRHHDVSKILRTPTVFSSADGVTIPRNPDAPVMPPIDLDPPLQAEFRQLLNPYFTSQAIRPYAPVIAALARQLVDRFAAQGHCELTSAFARPLPALVLGRLVLGIEDPGALFDLQSRVAVIRRGRHGVAVPPRLRHHGRGRGQEPACRRRAGLGPGARARDRSAGDRT